MRVSTYSVTDRRINFENTATITGNESVDTFHFDFDSEWNVFNFKYLVLIIGDKTYIDAIDSSNDVVLRSEVYDRDDVTFGVIAKSVPIENFEEVPLTIPTLSTNIVWLETIPSAFGQIKSIDGLPDRTVWELYTEEMLALVAEGQINVERFRSILEELRTDLREAMQEIDEAKESAQESASAAQSSEAAAKTSEDNAKTSENKSKTSENNAKASEDAAKASENKAKASENASKASEANAKASENSAIASENAAKTYKENAESSASSAQSSAESAAGSARSASASAQSAASTVNTAITNIQNEGITQVNNIATAGTSALTNINSAESNAITHIQEEGTSYDNRLDLLELLASNLDTKESEASDNLTITDALNAPVESNTLIGKTQQNSYTGKNIIPLTNQDFTILNTRFYVQNGTLYINGTSSSAVPANSADFKSNLSFILPAGTYTYTKNEMSGIRGYVRYYATDTDIVNLGPTEVSRTFTLAEETQVYCPFYINPGNVNNDVKTQIMIEEGSTATSYEPYVGKKPSPSPDFPQPINNVSGDAKEEASNKNLFNNKYLSQIENYNTYSNGIWTTNSGGSYFRSFFYGATGGSDSRDVTKLPKLRAGDYTIVLYNLVNNTSSTTNYISVSRYTENGVYVSATNGTNIVNINLAEDYYIDIRRVQNSGNFSFTGIGIYAGTYTASNIPAYLEHKGETVTFPLAEGQKMYEGDYLADDGIHHVGGQVVLDGTNNKVTQNDHNASSYLYLIQLNHAKVAGKSTHFIHQTSYPSLSSAEGKFNCTQSGVSIFLNGYGIVSADNSQLQTATEFNTWLSNNPVLVEYKLAQEVIEPYTEEQQIAWNNLQKLETYKNATHIYTSSDGISPNAKVTYLKNPLSSIEARLDLLEN